MGTGRGCSISVAEIPVLLLRLWLYTGGMTRTIELNDELVERLESHAEEDESLEEFIGELVTIYEQEGRFLDEGL